MKKPDLSYPFGVDSVGLVQQSDSGETNRAVKPD